MSSYGSLSPSGDNSPTSYDFDQPYYCAQMMHDSPISCESQFWSAPADFQHCGSSTDYDQYRESNSAGFINRRGYGYEDVQMSVDQDGYQDSHGYQENINQMYQHGNQDGGNQRDTGDGILCYQQQQLDQVHNPAVPQVRVIKRRNTANRKERRRTQSINTAFSDLRDCIPNVPADTKLSKNLNTAFTVLRNRIPNVAADTKLSKIKTLRLATSYIGHLMRVVSGHVDPTQTFCVDVHHVRRPRQTNISAESRRSKGRTGWPQHVWALELKNEN